MMYANIVKIFFIKRKNSRHTTLNDGFVKYPVIWPNLTQSF